MLKIRLQRVGRKHEPSFRLVLTDSKNSSKSGRFAEVLGSYDPRKSTEAFSSDRIKHWIAQGAGLTATVNNLLIKKGVIRGKKIDVSAGEAPVAQPTTDDSQPTVEAPTEETPQAEPEAAPVEEAPAPVAEAEPAATENPEVV